MPQFRYKAKLSNGSMNAFHFFAIFKNVFYSFIVSQTCLR